LTQLLVKAQGWFYKMTTADGTIEQQIERDVKTALLGGDSLRVTTLRGLKAVLLNVKVATGKRETGLTDEEVLPLLAKEAKKRQESADLYLQGRDQARADAELAEKAIIEAYLPPQLSEEAVIRIVDEVLAVTGTDKSVMGQAIGQVKARTQGAADGSLIAKLVKEKLQ
jgi:uncharacterized protein YqeY